MSLEAYVAIGFSAFLLLIVGFAIFKIAPRRVRKHKFTDKWRTLQKLLPDRTQWAQAIIEADDLLDEALKKKRFKGKTMGERLVAAQKSFSDNDAVWFGHKLRTKIDATPDINIRKLDVQKALVGLRTGLKDIGAL
jgi:hypothetical protein